MFVNYATKTLTCLVPRFYSACNVSGLVQLNERWLASLCKVKSEGLEPILRNSD